MAETHPDQLDLLSYVEEELADGERRTVADHLAGCSSCAEQVRLLQAGRDALRSAPLLELPETRRDEVLVALPERRRPWRPFASVRRGLLVAAPVAAAAVFVAVFVLAGTQLGDGGGDEEAGEAAGVAQLEEADDGAAGSDEAAGEETRALETDAGALATEPVRRVAGPPAAIVRILDEQGIEAVVTETGVVADATPDAVRTALASRRGGNVAVYVR